MTPKQTGLTKHPIYRELLGIGRHQKTIRPEALTNYHCLLESSEVRRRAGLDPTDAQLTRCASEALQDAIASIVSALNRTVAEAALCSLKKFEGKQISERLSEIPGMTEDIFRYRRQQAFETIVQYLTREDLPPGSQQTNVTQRHIDRTSVVDQVDKDLTLLVSDAATLHYAGLAVLFVEQFDSQLQAQSIPLEREARFGSFPLTPYFLRANLRFLYLTYRLPIASPGVVHTDFARPDQFLEACGRLPQLQGFPTTELVRLWHEAAKATPLSLFSASMTPDDKDAFNAAALGDLSYVPSGIIRGLDFWLGRGALVRKGMMKKQGPDRLKVMISAANSFSQALNRQITIIEPVFSRARRGALKAVATCYGFDEWAPLAGGASLIHRVEAYLDSEGMTLTDLQE